MSEDSVSSLYFVSVKIEATYTRVGTFISHCPHHPRILSWIDGWGYESGIVILYIGISFCLCRCAIHGFVSPANPRTSNFTQAFDLSSWSYSIALAASPPISYSLSPFAD